MNDMGQDVGMIEPLARRFEWAKQMRENGSLPDMN